MTRRCLLLFTGGLDTMLAAQLLLDQGIEVRALFVLNILGCGARQAEAAAGRLGIPLERAPLDADGAAWRAAWPEVEHGPNPCARCRAEMLAVARTRLERDNIEWVATGEVLGQRPGQNRKDLAGAAHRAGLDDRVLRPLSARLLPPTLAERRGWVDREKLRAIAGRGRKEQLVLAKEFCNHSSLCDEFGWKDVPPPGAGCPLDRAEIAARVGDLLARPTPALPADFAALGLGRHFRFDASTKMVVGRNAAENAALADLLGRGRESSWLLAPDEFPGPTVLVLGRQVGTQALEFAAGLMHRYGREGAEQRWASAMAATGELRRMRVQSQTSADTAEPIG